MFRCHYDCTIIYYEYISQNHPPGWTLVNLRPPQLPPTVATVAAACGGTSTTDADTKPAKAQVDT